MPLTRQGAVSSRRDVPGQIVQGITPGEWTTIPSSGRGADREQALAEFAARMGSPRSDIWGQPLREDTVEPLVQELLVPQGLASPGNRGFFGSLGLGADMVRRTARTDKPITTHIGEGGSLWQYNEKTKNWDQKVTGGKKMDAATKSKQSLLENRIKAAERTLSGSYLSATRAKELRDIAEQDKAELETLFAPAVAEKATAQAAAAGLPLAYPQTMDEANSMSMFGQSGARTPFAFIGGNPAAAVAPSVAAPMTAPSAFSPVMGDLRQAERTMAFPQSRPPTRRRFNPATGRIE